MHFRRTLTHLRVFLRVCVRISVSVGPCVGCLHRYLEQRGVTPLLSSHGIVVDSHTDTAPQTPDVSSVVLQIQEPGGNRFVNVHALVQSQDSRVRWLAPEQLRGAMSAQMSPPSLKAPTWAFGVVRAIVVVSFMNMGCRRVVHELL